VPLNPAPNVLPVSTPSEVEARATVRELHPIVRIGADGALGVNPGVGLGASLQLGIRSTHWALWLRAGYLTSTGRRFSAAAPGTIHGPTSELQLAVCRLVSGQVTVSVCGFGGELWVYARGEGFDRDRHALLNTAAVGASAELLRTINSYFAIGPRLDLLVPLAPVRYQVSGEPGSWCMWPVAPRVGLGVEWR